jgi:hypothetical protein
MPKAQVALNSIRVVRRNAKPLTGRLNDTF